MKRAGEELPRLVAASAAELDAWLDANGGQSGSVWLVTWKKGDPRHIPRDRLLATLIAHGWIDSLPRKLDAARTMLLISPRRRGSNWSRVNRDIADRLAAENALRPAGRAAIDAAKADGSWEALDAVDALAEPDDLKRALDAAPQARAFWDRFPPSSRRAILEWIAGARTAPTREGRIGLTVERARENRKANFPAGRDRGPAS